MAFDYKLVTMSVNWDSTYRNTMYFSTDEERNAYFNIPSIFDEAIEVNFPVGSLLSASVTYRGLSNNINELMNDNYCIIEHTTSEGEKEYFFYFIENCEYLTQNQVKLYIELDVIQSYMNKVNFSDCLIERAHLDRFVKNSDDTYSFNNSPESILLNSEGVNLPKYLKSAERLELKFDTEDGQLNNKYVNELLWAYVYVSNDGLELIKNGQQSFVQSYGTQFNNFTNPYTVLVAPVVDYDQIVWARFRTSVTDTSEIRAEWSFNTMLQYLKTGFSKDAGDPSDFIDLTPYILNVKLSSVPPFRLDTYSDNFITFTTVDDYRVYECRLIQKQASSSDVGTQVTTVHNNTLTSQFLAFIYQQNTADYLVDIELENNSFTRDYIVNTNYRFLEPKTLSENCQLLKIRDYEGNSIEYDMQKLNNSSIQLKLVEPFVVDKSSGFMSLHGIDNSIYKDSALGLLGLIYNNDTNIPYALDQLATYMANNKNFDKIRGWGIAKSDLTNTIKLLNPASMVSGATGLLSTSMDQKVVDLTLDNMSASPDTLKNLGGSIFLNSVINSGNAGFYKEIFSGTSVDMIKIIDYLHEFGYSYSQIGQPKDFLNTRESFNYIKADLNSITSSNKISNQVRERFRDIFSRGISFWRTDDFNLTTNNVERSILDDNN